ncbi:hypothetical protein BDA99DRAFT_510637 [Phascolomyces articulosus]|uniref:Uncharacterized protein n=1 Tax=Phascolomyces articulosus TaxID=60185 RepID=A0AAD5PDF8_9FUNG|nr:hypothetical protein BDA99DRAFT_510637 [Phascolomyces articulosus]
MIDLSSFDQKPGESWADMMDEEDEEEEKESNEKDESLSDPNASNNCGDTIDSIDIEENNTKQDLTDTANQREEKDDINDKEDNSNGETDIKAIDKIQAIIEMEEKKWLEAKAATKKTGNSGIVWRLPSAEQKKQQQEFIQRLVEQRQNIDKVDSWRKKTAKNDEDNRGTGASSWRSNKSYHAPEKNTSQQWHAYSEVLQQEYEEQVEESRKEFIRRFGSKNAQDKQNETSSSSPTPELPQEPTKPSILISADGPSDWADDIPTSDEEEEEQEMEEEKIEETKEGTVEIAEQSASESIPLPHDATISPSPLSEQWDESTKTAPLSIQSKSEKLNSGEIDTLRTPTKEFSPEQQNHTPSPPPTKKEPVVVDPSAWIAFAEQNSPKSSNTTSTPTVAPVAPPTDDAMPKDESLITESIKENGPSEGDEQLKDEPKETETKIIVQEDRTSSSNTFAEQSSSKWKTTTTTMDDSTNASKWASSTSDESTTASKWASKTSMDGSSWASKWASNATEDAPSTASSKWASPSMNELTTTFNRSPKMSNQSSIASKWASATIDDTSSEHSWHGSTPLQHHQQHLAPENQQHLRQSQSDRTTTTTTPKPKDNVMRSPRMQILNHLYKNSNNKRQQQTHHPPPSTTHSSPSLASTASETNPTATISEKPQQNPPLIVDNSQEWKIFAEQHNGVKSKVSLPNPRNDDNDHVKNHSSRQYDSIATTTDSADDWKLAGATWNNNAVSLDNSDDTKSHTSWKSDTKSTATTPLPPPRDGGRASVAWMAVSAKNDDDGHGHSSRRSDSKLPKVVVVKEEENNWSGGATPWNNMTSTQFDDPNDDIKSHTSHISDTRSSQREHNNQRASAAWIAAGVQIRGTQNDSSRRSDNNYQERDHGLGGSASSWTTTVTIDELMAGHRSPKVAPMKNDNEQTLNTWNTNDNAQRHHHDNINHLSNSSSPVFKSNTDTTTDQHAESSGESNRWQVYAKQHSNNKYGGDRTVGRSSQRQDGMHRKVWL